MDIQTTKQRFGIIGNDVKLNRALEKAIRVAPTDISVLVTGESGVGKESIPKIIHSLSHRKHNKYIAVNCGAIPEGTIDSELFGHEKGAFTGATQTRKGYFEVADGGTIFLDEVGELPLTTQVRLLRVLENGEFMKVGSSQAQKTDIRIVAATNLDMPKAIAKGKFREDLYYRLSTIEINLPPLRERREDVHLLFRKFASDFAQKYNMPTIRLTDDAVVLLKNYTFPGNIRQLRNIAEQLSVIEQKRLVDAYMLKEYLPNFSAQLPVLVAGKTSEFDFAAEREMIYKIMFELRKEINELKQGVVSSNSLAEQNTYTQQQEYLIENNTALPNQAPTNTNVEVIHVPNASAHNEEAYQDIETIEEEESYSLQDKEIELIKKALEKYNNKRKLAAAELGISERTLYRKIKQFEL